MRQPIVLEPPLVHLLQANYVGVVTRYFVTAKLHPVICDGELRAAIAVEKVIPAMPVRIREDVVGQHPKVVFAWASEQLSSSPGVQPDIWRRLAYYAHVDLDAVRCHIADHRPHCQTEALARVVSAWNVQSFSAHNGPQRTRVAVASLLGTGPLPTHILNAKTAPIGERKNRHAHHGAAMATHRRHLRAVDAHSVALAADGQIR
mmetsp:Transcript_41116/g.113315  ORF Transcript_41116/g.113315 Transcript_41116/m.113315 type:complete len:204 (+) Transcript_41116:1333-1944(+)